MDSFKSGHHSLNPDPRCAIKEVSKVVNHDWINRVASRLFYDINIILLSFITYANFTKLYVPLHFLDATRIIFKMSFY